MTSTPHRRRLLAEDEVRLSYYAPTSAHGAILFISLGTKASRYISKDRVTAHIVDRRTFDLRTSDTKGVCIRRYIRRPNMSVTLGASTLENEGLELGTWLRSTVAQWMPRDEGIRIRIDPTKRKTTPPPPERTTVAQDLSVTLERLDAIERRLTFIENAIEQLKRDIAGTDIEVDEETVAEAVETLRRAGYPVWQVADRWNVGTTLLASAAMVAMARRIASRSSKR